MSRVLMAFPAEISATARPAGIFRLLNFPITSPPLFPILLSDEPSCMLKTMAFRLIPFCFEGCGTAPPCPAFSAGRGGRSVLPRALSVGPTALPGCGQWAAVGRLLRHPGPFASPFFPCRVRVAGAVKRKAMRVDKIRGFENLSSLWLRYGRLRLRIRARLRRQDCKVRGEEG